MSDREALKQILFCFQTESKQIRKRWGDSKIPSIPKSRLVIVEGVVAWAQKKIVELNRQEHGDGTN